MEPKPDPRTKKNVVLIHHGHCDGADYNFIRQLACDCNLAGFQSCVMVRRGMETSKLTTPTLFSIDLFNDIEVIVEELNRLFDNPNLYTVGMSMGANAVLHNSGKAGEKWPFKA